MVEGKNIESEGGEELYVGDTGVRWWVQPWCVRHAPWRMVCETRTMAPDLANLYLQNKIFRAYNLFFETKWIYELGRYCLGVSHTPGSLVWLAPGIHNGFARPAHLGG